jgi:hypothetical protein
MNLVMPLRERVLLADIPTSVLEEALSAWSWLLGAANYPVFLTLAGDVFLKDASGAVYWLETGGGELGQVATSIEEFDAAWSDATKRREWLLQDVVQHLFEDGQVPKSGECFGFKVLPVFGGTYTAENRVCMQGSEHIRFTGYLHSQISDLPDRTRIRLDVVD